MSSEIYDALSIWIKNKQALENVDTELLLSIQQEIITEVFGGFDLLLQCLLRSYSTVPIQQQNKLFSILSEYSTDNDNELPVANNQCISILQLPDDCLSYTMKFLTNNDRHNAQFCCRLFTITARQESSVNDIGQDFPLMGLVPFNGAIIEGIKSNQHEQNMKSIKLCDKYFKDCMYSLYSTITNYSDEVKKKFLSLLLQGNDDLTTDLAIRFCGTQSITELIPICIKYMTQIDPNTANLELLEEIVDLMEDPIDYIEYPQFIPALLTILENRDKYPFKSDWRREELSGTVCDSLSNIIRYFPYSKYKQKIMDELCIESIAKMIHSQRWGATFADEVYKLLEVYLKVATREQLLTALNNKKIRKAIRSQMTISSKIRECLKTRRNEWNDKFLEKDIFLENDNQL